MPDMCINSMLIYRTSLHEYIGRQIIKITALELKNFKHVWEAKQPCMSDQ